MSSQGSVKCIQLLNVFIEMFSSQVFLEVVSPLGPERAVVTREAEARLTLILLVSLKSFLVFVAFVAVVTQELLTTLVNHSFIKINFSENYNRTF